MKNGTMSQLAMFVCVVLLAQCAPAANWYVRPSGGTNGDGTDYDHAWAGFGNIQWNSLADGDTLYVCDTHLGESLDVQRSYITVRGDYSGHPGIIDASVDIKGTTNDWTEDPSYPNVWKGQWAANVTGQEGYHYMRELWINGKWAIDVRDGWNNLGALTTEGDWEPSNDGKHLWIYSVGNPATHFSSIRHGRNPYCIRAENVQHTTIAYITVKGSGSNYGVDYSAASGGILIHNSSYIVVDHCTVSYCNFGIRMQEGGGWHNTFTNNTISQFQRYHTAVGYTYYGTGMCMGGGNDHVIANNTVRGGLSTLNRGWINWSGCGIVLRVSDASGIDGNRGTAVYGNEVYYIAWYGINVSDYDATHTNGYNVNISIYGNNLHHGKPTANSITDQDAISAGCGGDGWNDPDSALSGIHVYNNKIDSYYNSGVQITNTWTNCDVYNNMISYCGTINGGWGGIRINNAIRCFNNTITGCYGSGITMNSGQGQWVANNIIRAAMKRTDGSGGFGILVYGTLTATVYNNNIFACATASTSGPITRPNPVNGDALLVSTTDLHIQSGSPCIDAGIETGRTTDFDGDTIVYDEDVGADEYYP